MKIWLHGNEKPEDRSVHIRSECREVIAETINCAPGVFVSV
jgi:hypothetical protein